MSTHARPDGPFQSAASSPLAGWVWFMMVFLWMPSKGESAVCCFKPA